MQFQYGSVQPRVLEQRQSRADNDMDREEFFAWCTQQGFHTNAAIAQAFGISAQTVRNWRRDARTADGGYGASEQAAPRGGRARDLPGWVPHACDALSLLPERPPTHLPCYSKMSIDWFKDWQRRHGLTTYAETGAVFAVSRQAVHNWFQRGAFPSWIALACLGYDAKQKASYARNHIAREAGTASGDTCQA